MIMVDDPASAETSRQKLAQAARQDDMRSANDGARAAAQTSVLINGGAATAILAFLSTYLAKSAGSSAGTILYAASASLFGYAAGVSLGAWSMWCASQASGQFGLRWETFLDTDNERSEKEKTERGYLTEGDLWLKKHKSAFGLSIGLFAISSLVMALGFLLSVK
jgi:hypothetical protein